MIDTFIVQSPETYSRRGVGQSQRIKTSLQSLQAPNNTNRYDLLLLVKRVGKNAGFTPRMIALLDYYMSFTRDIDWEEGSRPIIYQSLSKTALDMGISERQVQKLERALAEIGVLTWNDSGNHKRYGKRDLKTGHILYAFGVDLGPLAHFKETLEEKLQEKRLYDQAWMETKRQISWYRAQIRAVIDELEQDTTEFQSAYQRISVQIRTHIDLKALRGLLSKHKDLYTTLCENLKPKEKVEQTEKRSLRNEEKFAHKESTIKKQSDKSDVNFTKNVQRQQKKKQKDLQGEPNKANVLTIKASQTGIEHVSLSQALNISSDSLRLYLRNNNKPNWNDYIDAAYRLREDLGINQVSWSRACMTMGRVAASVCLAITDRARSRPINPVLSPGAYFNSMIILAEKGNLKLHTNVFNLLEARQTIERRDVECVFKYAT